MSDQFEEEAAMPYDPEENVVTTLQEVAQRHTRELMAIDGVEGVGVSRNEIGEDAILVYLRDASTKSRVPRTIDGYPVTVMVTGIIDAS